MVPDLHLNTAFSASSYPLGHDYRDMFILSEVLFRKCLDLHWRHYGFSGKGLSNTIFRQLLGQYFLDHIGRCFHVGNANKLESLTEKKFIVFLGVGFAQFADSYWNFVCLDIKQNKCFGTVLIILLERSGP